MDTILEVCAGNLESAVAAAKGGAQRIELCAELQLDGLTPSDEVISAARAIPGLILHVLIRPRPGDFVYDADEVALMERQVRRAVELGADGVVIGALTREGSVDTEVCRRLVAAAREAAGAHSPSVTSPTVDSSSVTSPTVTSASVTSAMVTSASVTSATVTSAMATSATATSPDAPSASAPYPSVPSPTATPPTATSPDAPAANAAYPSVTFHRAFDVAADPREALEDIIGLGCDRLLTSGQSATALEGAGLIAELVRQAAGRIVIMPGAGVNPSNAAEILRLTGCREVHSSARLAAPQTLAASTAPTSAAQPPAATPASPTVPTSAAVVLAILNAIQSI